MTSIVDIPGLNALIAQSEGGSPEVRIAIIDGPVDQSHPAFAGARLTVLADHDTPSQSTHGTHVASVIAGQPGTPVTGIAPGCTVLCIPVYQEDPDGHLISCAQATLARGIYRALDHGATLINISGGQFTPTGQGDRFLEAAVKECARRNALIVASAGNDGCRCLHVPAALPTVLAVGACDRHGRPLPFSNHGDAYRDNGLLAPGEAIPGAGAAGRVEARTGTSFATPIVTAVAALLLSQRLRLGQGIDAQAIRQLLLDTATPVDPQLAPEDGRGPTGILDVKAAMAALTPPAPKGGPPLRSPATSYEASNALFEAPMHNTQPKGEANAMSATCEPSGHSPSTLLGPDGAPLSGVGPSTRGPTAPDQAQAAPSETSAAAAPAAAPAAIEAPAPVAVAAQSLPPQALQGGASQPLVSQPLVAQSIGPQAAPDALASPATAVAPSEPCGCAGVAPSQLSLETPVFVIGRLFYDFESEARFDYFVQAIADWRKRVDPDGYDAHGDYAAPWNAEIMVKFLSYRDKDLGGEAVNLPNANALIWTLSIDTAPIYAIQPESAFGFPMYLQLIDLLWHQELAEPRNSIHDLKAIGTGPKEKDKSKKPPVERVSQAGFVHGEARLMNGTVVPVLRPVWRGMFGWNTQDLAGDQAPEHFREFLERIYNQFRNVGVSPQDRAMNYSAFNAYNTKKIFQDMARRTPNPMVLDTVSVDRSTICRPEADCWDVTWTFFDPTATLTTARKVFQYTVDVSDVVPVTVGPLRDWMIF